MTKLFNMVGIIFMVVFFCVAGVRADTYVETDSGYAFHIPSGWNFQAVPEGFNTAPFNSATNPFGMQDGEFPLYNLYVKSVFNCDPGELVISPSYCPPRPVAIEPLGCYTYSDPEPEPDPIVCGENEELLGEVCVEIKPPKCEKKHKHDKKCRT